MWNKYNHHNLSLVIGFKIRVSVEEEKIFCNHSKTRLSNFAFKCESPQKNCMLLVNSKDVLHDDE